ncbi:hypothetical protein CICLE_v10019961mg [Citrus x clementina]|uniref:Uncharacterized protein n=2 Tax=Citrus TaxID=2706 RepID=A0ACB8MG78_CITSI|nr:uncharacterized protein LOC18049181 [Citrus x clementina]ESR56792.1 hypothetical protein CICLE_v10019961mg [Citrus x clementina]KAH9784771.1 hypothetical protein KPL71_009756 [Citrus sinensis]
MEKNSEMIGVKREEEIELELGLSIGGGFQRSERQNPSHAMTKNEPPGSDLRESHHNNSDRLQVESKREFEALRRLEAKRKRLEKQQKKITISCNNINSSGYGVGLDNKMWLKSPELETKEQQRECKKSRAEDEEEGERGPRSNMEMKNVNLNLTVEQNVGFNSTVCPVMYPYPPLQYVQFANGFQYPCLNVVPCWPAGGEGVGNYQVQSVVNRSFRPFQSGQESGRNMGNGCASDQNSWKAGSNGSPGSSAVSDYRSSSHEGGGSSDTRSHSSHSPPEQCKLQNSKADDTKGQSEHSTSPHRETAQFYDEMSNCPTNSGKPKTSSKDAQCSPPTNCTTNFVQQKALSNAVDCSPAKPKEEVATELHGASSQNPVSTTENLSPTGSKESKKDVGKPPKPQTQSQNTPSLPHMPCVSTTGNGPNGKTINGFLYRYTKTEVSIVCVCHGTSFSPAEFVLHAGGTDVSQPLKHITVIPSAF